MADILSDWCSVEFSLSRTDGEIQAKIAKFRTASSYNYRLQIEERANGNTGYRIANTGDPIVWAGDFTLDFSTPKHLYFYYKKDTTYYVFVTDEDDNILQWTGNDNYTLLNMNDLDGKQIKSWYDISPSLVAGDMVTIVDDFAYYR